MTWQELADALTALPKEYLKGDVFFHCPDCDEFYLVAIVLPKSKAYLDSDEPYLIDSDLSEDKDKHL